MRPVQHWGVTGWSTEWGSLDQADDGAGGDGIGFGFARVVEAGVVYFKPPIVGDWTGWRESPGNRQRRYQMAWPEDEAPKPDTVTTLHEQLVFRRATLEQGDEQLRQLDDSLLEAVRQVDRLHRAGGTLGFVQPDSIVFYRTRDGSLRVVFPDVGFAWDESRGLREPQWIAEPQLDCLFEEGPRRHNAASLAVFREVEEIGGKAAGKARGTDKASAALAAAQAGDVRMLARLIAVALAGPEEVRRWCGSGRAFLAVPGRDRAPDTQAPVWDQVITPALLHKITTATGLLERLELAPPSEHYLFKPPAPPPAWKILIRRALPGVIGVAAIVGLLLVAPSAINWVFPRRERHPLCEVVYSGDPRFTRLDAIEEARGRAQTGDLEVVAGYWNLLFAADDLPPTCMGALQKEAAKMIAEQAMTIPVRLREEPMPRVEQNALLQRAFQLATAAELVDPGGCRRVVALLRRQLQARGEVPRQAPLAGSGADSGSDAQDSAEASPAVRQVDPAPSIPSPVP
jgi:hypothetical protein